MFVAVVGQAHAAIGLSPGDEKLSADQQRALLAAPQSLYLDIVMDGQIVRPLVRFERSGGNLSVDAADLDAIGLLLPADVTADPTGRIALDAIDGLSYAYDAALQQVVLVPAPGLRRANQIGYRSPTPITVNRDQGLVLDWDAYTRRYEDSHTESVGTSLRWFGRFGSLQNTGVSRTGDQDNGYLRLDSRWMISDPQNMWTWTAGDLISGGLSWSRPVRMGGVQWRRNFSVRPDLIIYPMPQFAADATVPSSVDLYINNVRQFSTQVDPGPFVLSDFPRLAGAGQATVVVTDALGRTTQTVVPLYVDYQRLARGLNDFSFEAGALRRNYGLRSNDYSDHIAASGSWRRGLTDNLTGEMHGEYGDDLTQGGVGMAWSPMGRFGVFSANYAYSGGLAGGEQYGGGYQWFGQRVGFDLYAQRASRGYRDLGSIDDGSLPLLRQDRASAWLSIPRGSISLSWIRYEDRNPENPGSRTIGFGFNQSYRAFSWTISAFDDDRSGRGASLSLSIPLGDLDASLSVDRQGGETDAIAALRKPLPYGGGLGWEVQARDNGDGVLGAGWRARSGDVWGGLDHVGNETGAFAQANGSVVWMGGSVFTSRTIPDSFAVVSTNGVADVPILYENRVAGRTNSHGYLLLPELRGWQRNRVAIDPDGLPSSMEVPSVERLVTPPDRSGVHVPFAIRQVRTATITLRDANGQPVEAGMRVVRADGREAIVAFDGALWLDNYTDGETLRWTRAGVDCSTAAPAMARAAEPGATAPAQCRTKEQP
ncbi:fimbria/pilus outer membrane usher protein [Lysobacter sp. LF1]|uniref:Fimbria/pilus outer membrane usher protein n=1 Tax=Lysobacter stagni TaxID=3045172 RepID=A0ABT6XDH1_9GAMM|nr:fimbria/pilus outer membrane usher protein [Lysobacter sp. LF1]MDI9238196.1 fimbria/pilus outer membrane usher protein [Lysobacter sp. LF1]